MNNSEIQNKVSSNPEIQEAFKRFIFTIRAEIDEIDEVSVQISFRNGEVIGFWDIDKN
jgi:hypothetical protein